MQRPDLGRQTRCASTPSSRHPLQGARTQPRETHARGAAPQAFVFHPTAPHAGVTPAPRNPEPADPGRPSPAPRWHPQRSAPGLKGVNGVKPASPASAQRVGPQAPGCPQGPVPSGVPGAAMGRMRARRSAGSGLPQACGGTPRSPLPPLAHAPISSKHWWDTCRWRGGR